MITENTYFALIDNNIASVKNDNGATKEFSRSK